MEIDVGRKNLAFGWMWLALGMLFGFFMFIKMRQPEWAGNPFELTNWLNHAAVAAYSYPRAAWRLAHAHWATLGIVNIVFGMLIDRVELSRFAKQAGSVLCILGTMILAAGFFAAGLNPDFSILAVPGFLCVAIAAVIQLGGWLKTVR